MLIYANNILRHITLSAHENPIELYGLIESVHRVLFVTLIRTVTMAFLLYAVLGTMILLVQAEPVKWIDLSYRFAENETIYWPAPKERPNTPFFLKVSYKGDKLFEQGVYVLYSVYGGGEHGGTHIDAPNHFIRDGISLDKVTIDRLVGDGIVVNISAKAAKDPDAELEISDLEEWEKKHGRMPDNPVVFMYSGWGKFYPDPFKFFGTNNPRNGSTFHFPGLNADAAKWLIEKRKIKMFASDTASIERGQNVGFPTHKILLGASVPGIEMAAYVDRLPPKGFEVFAFPMKIKGGSGGPVRVFARIADKTEVGAASHAHFSLFLVVIAFTFCVCL